MAQDWKKAKRTAGRVTPRLLQTAAEYRFKIDAFTPDTIPMARLAEYMAELATMLGNEGHVHFVKLEKGSCNLVHKVEWESIPKVRERVRAVRQGDAPEEALKAFTEIDKRLAQDNAIGILIEPGGKNVIQFPGRKRAEQITYPPIKQLGTLDGIPIVIGGETDPVPVHLEDHGRIHNCHAKRSTARAIAAYLFTTPIRVEGTGRWRRDEISGTWTMERFIIHDFKVLDDAPLSEAIQKLRAVEGDWKKLDDPLGELRHLRHDEDDKVN